MSHNSSLSISIYISSTFFSTAMKLISQINPKRLFRSKKPSRSVTRSDPSSFSSTSTDSAGTATTVLPPTPGHISNVAHAFKLIDKDGDGKIDLTELEEILNRIGPNNNDDIIKSMLTEMDVDGDGCISLEEFGAIGSAFDPTAEEEDLIEAFKVFDTDCDGKITAEELREVFTALGDDTCTLEECRRMVREVGTSGDGFVCFQDFVRMMELQR